MFETPQLRRTHSNEVRLLPEPNQGRGVGPTFGQE